MCLQPVFSQCHSFTPPLRLVLTTGCNGICSYCHHEGKVAEGQMFTTAFAIKCAEIAGNMGLPEICLTGGEPTLHPFFGELVSSIQAIYHGNINLTTNGCLLSNFHISTPIHRINLSISSFSKDIYDRYQRVDPDSAIQSMIKFPATKKNVNIVVTNDNYKDIETILDRCKMYKISADIMFELKEYTAEELSRHKQVLTTIENYGTAHIQLSSTPTIIVDGQDNFKIRIKHPKLSKLLKRQICASCETSTTCYEGLCAVRVYPDGLVSACLNKQYVFTDGNIKENIEKAYAKLSQDSSLLSALLS